MTQVALPLTRPLLGEEEERAVAAVLASGWVAQGPKVEEFENVFAKRVGAKHAVAVSNCTVALHLALRAVGVRAGDVVATVSHSFIATANAIRMCGAEPVFVDINLATYNMSPEALDACIEEEFASRSGGLWYRNVARLAVGESPLADQGTRHRLSEVGRLAAVLVVHQVGLPVDLPPLLRIAKRAGVPVIEDAACAIGSDISTDGGLTWEAIGHPHGAVACFSFHPRKVVTTGEGGMITTQSSEFADQVRLLRHHGMTVSDVARDAMSAPAESSFVTTAYNYRLSDILAAVGLCQLDRLPVVLERRRKLARMYAERLAPLRALHVPSVPSWARTNWQSYIVRLEDSVDRASIQRALAHDGIASRPGIMCAHLEPPYRDPWKDSALHASERAYRQGLTLPLFPQMTESDIERVAVALERALA